MPLHAAGKRSLARSGPDPDGAESDESEPDPWDALPTWTATAAIVSAGELSPADEKNLTKVNKELLEKEGVFHVGRCKVACLQADVRTGVCMSYTRSPVTHRACEEMSSFLVDPQNRTEHGHLQIGGVVFSGFGNYRQVHVEREQLKPHEQEQFTSMLPQHFMQHAYMHMPGFEVLVGEACKTFGVAPKHLKHVHALVQANPHALFSWHDDASDMRLSARSMTVIVALNQVLSAFQLWGFSHVLMSSRAQMVAFPGAALHRSLGSVCSLSSELSDMTTMPHVMLKGAPHKLVMFFD